MKQKKRVLLRVKRKISFTTKETKQIRMRMFTCNKISTTENKIKQEVIYFERKQLTSIKITSQTSVPICTGIYMYYLLHNLAFSNQPDILHHNAYLQYYTFQCNHPLANIQANANLYLYYISHNVFFYHNFLSRYRLR